MEKQSPNVQMAVGALIATLFSLGIGVALGLARQHPMPGPIITEQTGFRDMENRPVDGEHSIVIGWKK